MTKSKIFLKITLSFIGGVFAASFLFSFWKELYAFILIVLALILAVAFYRNKLVFVVSFCLLVFVGGTWLTISKIEKSEKYQKPIKLQNEKVLIETVEKKEKYTRFRAKPEKQEYKILVYHSPFSKIFVGDRLEISCDLEVPKNFEESFDYKKYLAKDNVYFICQDPEIKILEKAKSRNIKTLLFKLREEIGKRIESLLPSPESGLMIGLLLGGDDKLPENWQEKFSLTAMTHIVAVSGYNVTIIAEYLMFLAILAGFWRKQALYLAVVGIFLFVALIGFPPSGVRAAVMGSLILWAAKHGRLASSTNAIIFAGALMLLINPMLLRWDIGFQLSFLATLGIIYLSPVWENFFRKRNIISTFWEILFLTLSAQIFVLPVILKNFGNLSLVSPLANLLILPIIPITMLLGFLSLVFSFIFLPLGKIFSWLAYLPLRFETEIIDFLSGLSWAGWKIKFPIWAVFVWYLLLIVFILIIKKKKNFLSYEK